MGPPIIWDIVVSLKFGCLFNLFKYCYLIKIMKIGTLQIIGIILMAIGAVVVLSALPILPFSIVEIGVIKAEVSPMDSTRIAVGSVIFVLGLLAYLGERGLKIFK